ncbi:unnamed protein product [Orchesella dallaii]|uniref:PIH1 domain-containing protein 1 n=1 Tax=Orchesella dallaii TaxID=48710 RepID=A0ABP1S5D6_9HEXA
MANFLDVDESIITRNLLISNSILKEQDNVGISTASLKDRPLLTPLDRQEQAQCKFIIPQPGLCVKTFDKETGQKVFVNICKTNEIPEPDFDYTDEQIANILSNGSDDDVGDIRIPMSIGEKHEEKDNKGGPCLAVEVIINTNFFEEKILASEVYRTFLIVISMEGLDEKHKLSLEKNNYTILHNKKSVGKLNPQFVKAKPSIRELKSAASNKETVLTNGISNQSRKLVEEVATNETQLECTITQTSSELAKAEIRIPRLRNPKKLTVNLGADRIIVDSPVGSLDVFVPLDIHQEECRAEFNVESETLNLHLPLIVKP